MTSISRTLVLALLAAGLVAGALAPAASAHASKTSDDGRIKVTWGWTNEPALTETANGLDLAFRYASNNTGVKGAADAGLHVEMRYGAQTHVFEAIQPQHGREAEGRYTGLHPITPSEPGLYILHVRGTLHGSTIDLEIPANHEVDALESSYFPPRDDAAPAGGDASALEARLAALEQKVAALEAEAKAQSQTPAPTTTQTGTPAGGNGTPGFGAGLLVGALAAVALAVAVRRRA